ncbi:UNVERIFIED_CONTAM: WD repeat-containing protein 44 [Sesamum radiatum]|uniref:WD repeat-containing protein 44 n=1 Tax=Sesamum radiatum TaxID=300843 RepID=A0AAW2NCU0_SESRA
MDSFIYDDEESHFFDAQEHIAQEPDNGCSSSRNWGYDVWTHAPQSVRERRRKFIRWMGLGPGELRGENSVDMCGSGEGCFSMGDFHRIMEDSGAVLRTSSVEDEFSSNRSSVSSWNTDDLDLSQGMDLRECRNGNVKFHGGTDCNVDAMVKNERLSSAGPLSQFSPSVQQFVQREIEVNVNTPRTMKYSWLRTRIQRVRVRHCRRRVKEISALFTGQDIQAHEGSIISMKFSPDGQYLASAGEDKIVRIWQVVEDERSDRIDVPDADPSFFRILEKPLHVFQGHSGDILDLSWSKNNCLLSSSIDKTVRLWRVGVDHCLKVFQHSDYVTCIQFNPVNDDYFISGSIDGKVRIWTIGGCRVVDWAETRDIITAVSYCPDGQFPKQDPSKVLVTCADSKVRVIDRVNIIGKYKGLRNTGNQISASFTADGKHIVSASDDSNVYIWNYVDQRESSFSQPKAIRSFECFSSDASIAIPWSGLKTGNSEEALIEETSNNMLPFSSSLHFSLSQEHLLGSSSKGSATWPEEKLPASTPQASTPPMSKSQYNFFKNSCQSSSSSHAWGLVIVTAGWDGRIRSFHNYGLPVPL